MPRNSLNTRNRRRQNGGGLLSVAGKIALPFLKKLAVQAGLKIAEATGEKIGNVVGKKIKGSGNQGLQALNIELFDTKKKVIIGKGIRRAGEKACS